MKTAVILAGGLGTRLRPITYATPKPLILINNKTLLECVIDKLLQTGINHIFLSIGYLHDKIVDYVDKIKIKDRYKGITFHFLVEEEELGTAGWLNLVKPGDKKRYFDEQFIVVNGDNLFDLSWDKFIERANKKKGIATLALTSVDDVSAYGVAKLDEEGKRIEMFVEKPKKQDAPSNKINSGYYILSPKIFDIASDIDKKKIMFEKDIFPILAKQGLLYYYIDDAKWFDTGTFERWKKASESW